MITTYTLRRLGLTREADRLDLGKCPTCGKDGPFTFKDELSQTEHSISKMCQECQDGFFSQRDEDTEGEI